MDSEHRPKFLGGRGSDGTSPTFAKKTPATVPRFRLVKSDSVLDYRAHNQYILSGFRPDADTSLTHALFYLHGQSFNIWSHLAGTIIFVLPRLVAPIIPTAPLLSAAL